MGVEDQLHQRGVVAPVAHHVVIAGAEETSLILRIVREEAAALLDIERVRENGSEALERGLIAGALGCRNHEVGIARASPRGEGGPAVRRFLVQAGIFRNFGQQRGRIGIVAQSLGVGIAAMRVERPQLPVQQGLRSGGQSAHHRGGKCHSGVLADANHEVAHLDAGGADLRVELISARPRQGAPHRLKFGNGANLLACRFGRFLEDAPDRRQILRTHLRLRRDVRQRGTGRSRG